MRGLSVFPAHAGVIRRATLSRKKALCFPRTRGGDPVVAGIEKVIGKFSPHARG